MGAQNTSTLHAEVPILGTYLQLLRPLRARQELLFTSKEKGKFGKRRQICSYSVGKQKVSKTRVEARVKPKESVSAQIYCFIPSPATVRQVGETGKCKGVPEGQPLKKEMCWIKPL